MTAIRSQKELIPTIIQDVYTQKVLGLAWSSSRSLALAQQSKQVVLESRKRGLWIKSGTTGRNKPRLIKIQQDCDKDALLFLVSLDVAHQQFCHVDKYVSCFDAGPVLYMSQDSKDVLKLGYTLGRAEKAIMSLLRSIGFHVYKRHQSRNDVLLTISHHHPNVKLVGLKPADISEALRLGWVDYVISYQDCLQLLPAKNVVSLECTQAPSLEYVAVAASSWHKDMIQQEELRVIYESNFTDTLLSWLAFYFPGKKLTLQRVHGHSESLICEGMADIAIVIRETGETIKDHQLQVLGVISRVPLTLTCLTQTRDANPNLMRKFRTALAQNDIYFYSVKDDPMYGFLSNFYPCPFVENDLTWKSSEHYYQAHKFAPESKEFELVRQASTPKECYKIAHSVPQPADWEGRKDLVMKRALFLKFSQNADLARKLLDTHPKHLIEHAMKDYHYGCGADGSGLNRLGTLLMALRDTWQIKSAL